MSATRLDTQSTKAPSSNSTGSTPIRERLWPYLLMGLYLGIVLTRGEVVSWFRIQEMFRFQSFHMYGIIGSAVFVGGVSVWLIQRFEVRSLTHRRMEIPTDTFTAPGYQYWIGGILFGLGWGLLGACPGPMYVLMGSGVTVMFAAFLSALVGVWSYGTLRHRLPHS